MADGYPSEIPLLSPNYKAVSMQHAIAKGFAGIYSDAPGKGVRIDLNTDSEGRREIDRMLTSMTEILDSSPTLKTLLEKNSWSKQEREQWESTIADVVRDAIYESERFGNYRLDRKKPMSPISITKITKDTNFHCEPMAALTGLLIQKLENHYLQPSTDRANLKRRTDYYLTGGILYASAYLTAKKPKELQEELTKGELLHGYVLSPITGNYFEGTQSRDNGWGYNTKSSYRIRDMEAYTFDDYLAGFPLVSEGAGLTLSYDGSMEAQALARARKEAVQRGDYRFLKQNRMHQPRFDEAVFSDERGLLLVSYHSKDSVNPLPPIYSDRVRTVDGLLKYSGRSYEELIRDAQNVDFALTEDEFKKLMSANRVVLGLYNRQYWSEVNTQGFTERAGRVEWNEAALAEHLNKRGVSDVWVLRPIPSNAEPSANNFEAAVKVYFDQIPAERLTVKDEAGGEQKITFADYLKFCTERYKNSGGDMNKLNAPGTVVPVLYDPRIQYKIHQQMAGRPVEQYYKEDVFADFFMAGEIANWPGVECDSIKLRLDSVISGRATTIGFLESAHIPETLGELSPPVVAQTAGASASKPECPKR